MIIMKNFKQNQILNKRRNNSWRKAKDNRINNNYSQKDKSLLTRESKA